jgi:hypothetical protein
MERLGARDLPSVMFLERGFMMIGLMSMGSLFGQRLQGALKGAKVALEFHLCDILETLRSKNLKGACVHNLAHADPS